MSTAIVGEFEWDTDRLGVTRGNMALRSRKPQKSVNECASSARARPLGISESSIPMARKSETDLSRYDLAKAERGKYAAKARRSMETIVVNKKVLKTLGGPEALVAILEALAKSIEASRKKSRAA